jgi:hypothetical protein
MAMSGYSAAIGLADLLLASAFPLVMRKAFGSTAATLALVLSIGCLVGLFAAQIEGVFPAMVVLGPVMVLQYIVWRWRQGAERTTRQYRLAGARP